MNPKLRSVVNRCIAAGAPVYAEVKPSAYEVIESKVWENSRTGARASIYGALPWPYGASEAEKAEWGVKAQGWTVRNPLTGEVGVGRKPSATKAEAEALAVQLGRPSSIGIGS